MAKTFEEEMYEELLDWWNEIAFIRKSKKQIENMFKSFELPPEKLEELKAKLNEEIEESRIHVPFDNRDLWLI